MGRLSQFISTKVLMRDIPSRNVEISGVYSADNSSQKLADQVGVNRNRL
jgi:hypothetical protein